MKPIEAFDVRGYVGYLSAYITSPHVPALLVSVVRGADSEEPRVVSVNLEDYGWYPSGLQFAIRDYDSYDEQIGRALCAHGALKFTGTAIPGPHGPGWKVYDLVANLKPGVLEAWQEHLRSLDTPIEAIKENLAKAAFGRSVPTDGGTCIVCGKGGLTREDFKDELSWREFNITKFCQKDQDEFYGDGE